ncbi:MAG: ABC transporter ATP-binding protein [Acidobacteria bacterium]|nr:MAG: ABC transporter ATP-binding protein [Acidobacteriota bacterium]
MLDSNTHRVTRFEKITVKHFRRLCDVDLELRPLTVLIGANGTGKTSLLDVFSLLASSAQGSLNKAVSDFSGLSALITYDRPGDLSLGISMSVPYHNNPLEYELRLKPQGTSYVIDEEILSQQRYHKPPPHKYIESRGSHIRYFEPKEKRLLPPTWEHNSLESSLSQVPKMYQEPEDFRWRLASSTFYHVLNVEPRSPVRLPQPLRPAPLPGKDGEDLVSCLFNLREADRDRFEAVEDSLRAAFPTFDRLETPSVAAGTLAMTWRDKNLSKALFMHQLSEGMLRFLWLVTLLESPGLTAVTLLDEPEVSLHPELLSLLAGLLREAANRTQLIVATHSDRLVRFLKPAEVVVIDSADDGMAQFTWADKMDLNGWLAEYTLDEVWRMGHMGGRA